MLLNFHTVMNTSEYPIHTLTVPIFLDPIGCLQEGFAIFKPQAPLLIGYTFLMLVTSFGLSLIPLIGPLADILLIGVLYAGMFMVIFKLMDGQPVLFANFFDGFKDPGKFMLFNFLNLVLVLIGMFFFIIPGLYLAIAWSLSIPILLHQKTSVWKAMEISRKAVTAQLLQFVVLFLVVVGVNLLGGLLLGIGLLVSIPVSFCAIAVAYRKLFPRNTLATI